MRVRLFIAVALAGALVAGFVPAGAERSKYSCTDSAPVGLAPQGPHGIGTGPACSFVVTCPIAASHCDVDAFGVVNGIGLVGFSFIVGEGFSQGCAAPLTCSTPDVVLIPLGPGEQISIGGAFGPLDALGPIDDSPAVAALAKIHISATRTDS